MFVNKFLLFQKNWFSWKTSALQLRIFWKSIDRSNIDIRIQRIKKFDIGYLTNFLHMTFIYLKSIFDFKIPKRLRFAELKINPCDHPVLL